MGINNKQQDNGCEMRWWQRLINVGTGIVIVSKNTTITAVEGQGVGATCRKSRLKNSMEPLAPPCPPNLERNVNTHRK